MTYALPRSRWSRFGALLQCAVFLLLQVSLLLPPVLQALTMRSGTAVCRGNHEECGCAPARVAAGTCCCAISSLPPCCKKKAQEKEQAEREVVAITNLPCGSDEPLTLATCEAYLPPAHAGLTLDDFPNSYAQAPPGRHPDNNRQPPVPPPRFQNLS